MKISNIKENARVALTGKWGKGACIILGYLAFAFVAGFIIGLVGGDETAIGSLLNLVYIICEVPLVFGISYAFIKLKRNEEVKAFDYITLGFSNFGRAWKISLRTVLKTIIPLIIYILVLTVSIVLLIMSTYLGDVPIIITILGIIATVFTIVWLYGVILLYSLTTYIAYDNPNMSSLEVVNESAKMMKGNRWKIFLLVLSFIGWAILSIFTLGIGYIWLTPYMMVSQVCFYENLLENKEENYEESNVDAIREM